MLGSSRLSIMARIWGRGHPFFRKIKNTAYGCKMQLHERLLKEKADDVKATTKQQGERNGNMEMTPRENMMAIYEGRQPEYYADFMSSVKIMMDPVFVSDSVPEDGLEHKDSWGTVCVRHPGAPGKHPHVTSQNAVVKDVTEWKSQLAIPSYRDLDWSTCVEAADRVDRKANFVMYFCAQGLFERSHFLMGMEDAFCAYLEEPEAMFEMLSAIAEYKKAVIKEAAYHLRPDVIFFQDDWGSKQNLFLPPNVWREMIKPLQTDIAKTIHECGMMYVHHADCICEPIVEDMVDIGIDIWQGVIPQNDILSIQERVQGKLALIGGIDGPAIDNEDTPDEEIVKEVHRCIDAYCPGGRFFPGSPAPLLRKRNNDALNVELLGYGREWALAHPVDSQ